MIATPILPGLSPVAGKPLTATFDAGRLSSDGGLIVLREIATRLGLAETITGPLADVRDPSRVRHSYAEMALARMLIARVEATAMGTDARFIVTSLSGRGKALYEKVFCARGAAENLIKDMKRWTRSDKTACSRWQANQFRLFLHVGAYWLLHSLRQGAPKRSRWRGATFETIRRTFVKIAVRVEELKGKIKLAFPASYPHAAMLVVMTGAITARGP